ncbi:beta-galactosidase [Fretibacter rubidus]|uniref:beta-galactosidase n=1 Tax=Fretibacter rubidus TaxID=570162 RepID=UPI00352B0B06
MSKPELGVCYYPEHWPESGWTDDAARMVEMGISWVRIGEFAWSRIEPTPGDLRWDWLDTAIEILGEAGLHVVLGTPTATPPRWMVDRHPDMLAVSKDGQPRKFGSRRHYCFSHLGYKDEAKRITELMAKRYGANPHIAAWQTDNEYGCHDTILSYSDAARAAFRVWLRKKYETIDALNTAWGNVFWSMEYNGFDQVDLPNQTVTEPNPAHVMDFRRFSSDQVVDFNRAQCSILRAYTDAPIIHNYMGRITDFDHFAVGADLDIASWDSYPLGFLEDRSDQGEDFKHDYQRQGDPDFQAFHHDLYRAVGGMRNGVSRWWVMEQQPGPVNWAPYNPAPLPGMVRLWTWEAVAHGAEVVSYFRWRQAPFAQEQMHAGLLRPDGVMAEGGAEAARVSKELLALDDADAGPSSVAIVFDYASAWAWETQPQGQDFDYFHLVYDVYRGLRRLGVSVDIVPPSCDDLSDRALVITPGLFAWTDSLRAAMKRFEGQMLIGPRTGSKTDDFAIPASLPPGIDGFDCKVTAVESLRSSGAIDLIDGGCFQIWREFAETSETVTETGSDGHPALITKGKLTYMAGWPDDRAMTRILDKVCKRAGVETTDCQLGYRRRDFGHYTLHMNYGAKAVTHTGILLSPADIALFDNKAQSWIIKPSP